MSVICFVLVDFMTFIHSCHHRTVGWSVASVGRLDGLHIHHSLLWSPILLSSPVGSFGVRFVQWVFKWSLFCLVSSLLATLCRYVVNVYGCEHAFVVVVVVVVDVWLIGFYIN